MAHDATGNLVPGRVTQLLHNVTDTWLHLSNGTYVTPGHRYLRPDGSFAEIQDIIADDGLIVTTDGSVQRVTAEVIRYSAETAHMFEQAEMLVYASEGGAALEPEVKRGWKTYNFTVAEHHTYIADGIRVHNESVLSTLKAGDVLLSLDDTLQNAAMLRDVNGDGRPEIVIVDGVREPGANTLIAREYTYTAPPGVSDVAKYVQDKMAAINGRSYTGSDGKTHKVDIYGQPLDPRLGNGPRDGKVSDDMDEMLTDDLGFTRTLTAENALYLSTGITPGQVTQFVSGGVLYLTITQADGTQVTEAVGAAATIGPVRFSDGSVIDYDDLTQLVRGTSGNDRLTGTSGADALDGLGGNDTLIGGNGNDSLTGGSGNDVLIGGNGADRLDGGSGSDWADYSVHGGAARADLATGAVSGAAAGDTLISIENLRGGSGNDTLLGNGGGNALEGGRGNDWLYGRNGNDTLRGQDGNDVLVGGAGADRLEGGAGRDTAHYGTSGSGLIIDLLDPSNNTGDAKGDSYASIENIKGSAYDDWIRGNTANNIINGGAGNDSLVGDRANDVMIGGSGADVFIFGARGGADQIADFEDGVDSLRLMDFDLHSYADLRRIASSRDVNGDGKADLVLDFSNGNQLTILDLNITALQDDLIFG